MPFISKRFAAEFSHSAQASPKEVFPLFCPIRELEWIPGWNYELVYSESGFVENNCIFTSRFPNRGEGTYVVSQYDPEKHAIGFVIFFPGFLVKKLNILVRADQDGNSIVHWQRTYTGLSEEGNLWAANYVKNLFQERMQFLAESMNCYFAKKVEKSVSVDANKDARSYSSLTTLWKQPKASDAVESEEQNVQSNNPYENLILYYSVLNKIKC